MRNFTGHQELQRGNRAGIVGKIDQSLVDNFGTSFCRNVTP
jgi:hypothetical protein